MLSLSLSLLGTWVSYLCWTPCATPCLYIHGLHIWLGQMSGGCGLIPHHVLRKAVQEYQESSDKDMVHLSGWLVLTDWSGSTDRPHAEQGS